MTQAVDLTNLRDMTEGDTEMERELFAEFISSFEKELDELRASLGDDAGETWRRRAHALKGVAFNLGAMRLGELCKKAQETPQSDAEAKSVLLEEIDAEFDEVQRFLDGLMAAA